MIGKILLGLLALVGLALVLVLVIPVGVELRYRQGELTAWLTLLGCKRIDLYPAPPPKEKKKQEEPPPKEPAAEKKPPPPGAAAQRLMDMLTMVSDLLPTLGETMGYILRRLTLKRCRITMVVGKEDAADTALFVGQIHAIGYNLYAILLSWIRVKEFYLWVTPDFTGPTQQADAQVSLRLRPSSAVMGGLIFLWKGGPQVLRTLRPPNKKKKKQKKRPGATRSRRNNVKVGATDAPETH